MSRTRPCSAASQAERKANRCCRSPRPRRKHDRAGAITRGLGPASKESAFRAQHVAGDDELLDLAPETFFVLAELQRPFQVQDRSRTRLADSNVHVAPLRLVKLTELGFSIKSCNSGRVRLIQFLDALAPHLLGCAVRSLSRFSTSYAIALPLCPCPGESWIRQLRSSN